ncbi:diguanylate cyclase [Caenispirillum salinarum AK4]|uniref:Diguanylate cyclase n=1 Tax=Caenispirillum salinarum AK4 TaxID=1238182 RepID=K9GRG6_9PROT|nr:bifunctional diguanylate cyclase/phosphodiesterase [Caenispirillum salinarum]EKV27727.1 diguanylate cyclase [Caenispirillum salinarum AK4]
MKHDRWWLDDLKTAVDQVAMVSVQRPDGIITDVNENFCRATGYQPNELVGREYRSVLGHPDEPACDAIADALRARRIWRGTLMQKHRDGRPFWTEAIVHPFVEEGMLRRIITIQRDITAGIEVQANLDKAREELETVQKIAHIGSWEWDLASDMVACSEETLKIFSLFPTTGNCVSFGALLSRVHPDDHAFVRDAARNIIDDGEPRTLEFRLLMDDSQLRMVSVHAVVAQWTNGAVTAIGGTTHDVTDRAAAELELRKHALHDPLTGLPNRLAVRKRVDAAAVAAMSTGNVAAVLFLDLDGFKDINDRLGHEVGDRLLQAVSERLRTAVRSTDMVSRLGGDEFVIVLEGLGDPGTADTVAAGLLQKLQQPIELDGRRLTVSASVGIAVCPRDGTSAAELLRAADLAMYRVKSLGRNGYIGYQRDWGASSNRRLALIDALEGALERDEFHVHYQPQLCLSSRRIISVEALLRWHAKDLGPVSPAEFIPLLEQTGAITSVGAWTLRAACADAAAWANEGHPLRVAVNVSYAQLARAELLSAVTCALEDSGLDPDLLELELTESMFSADVLPVVETLRGVRALGVSVAVDDFGVGYSSLGHLKRFPVNVLKIDKVFTEAVHHQEDDAAIVGAIVALARSLDMRVVAEGIEEESVAKTCQQLGCHIGQGYFFARPMPGAEITALLKAATSISQKKDPRQ